MGVGRVAALDGVRGVAIALVLVSHANVPGLYGAGVPGVLTFFVLSGYVITNALLRELDGTGQVHLRRFYARRAARLLPAMLLMVVVTVALMPLFGLHWKVGAVQALPGLLYVANVARSVGIETGPMQHLWTLSVEEQFYLLWPGFLAVVVWKARHPLAIIGALVAASVTMHVVAPFGFDYAWNSFEANAFTLAAGCGLALWERRGNRAPSWLVWPGLVVCAVSIVGVQAGTAPSRLYLSALSGLGGLLVVAGAAHGWRRFESRWLVGLGRISYGVYLWNLPLFVLVSTVTDSPWVRSGVCVVSVAVSAASFRWMEQPIIRWARRRLDRPLDYSSASNAIQPVAPVAPSM